jgi:hypothetical protein
MESNFVSQVNQKLIPINYLNLLTTMKKLLYILAFAFVTSISVTSCTEEEIAPQTELRNGGGDGLDKVQK